MSAVEAPVTPRYYGRSALVAGVRGAWRGWRVVAPAVVLNAAVQALLVLPDPIPGQSSYAGVLAAVSFVALLGTAALLTSSALESVHGPVRWTAAAARARRSAAWFALWFVVWVAVGAIGLALWTWPGLLWLALTPYLLLAASGGRRDAIVADVRAIVARPARWLVTTLLVAHGRGRGLAARRGDRVLRRRRGRLGAHLVLVRAARRVVPRRVGGHLPQHPGRRAVRGPADLTRTRQRATSTTTGAWSLGGVVPLVPGLRASRST